jgi:alkylation response protein AidB-like acyl-CoA dehydrogenase
MYDYTDDNDPQELIQLCSTVRRFAEQQLRVSPEQKPAFRRSDFEQMARLGLCGMSAAESHGGSGLPLSAQSAAIFELSRAQLGPAIYLSVHLMVARLLAASAVNPEQQVLLRKLCSGEFLAAFCLTEAGAGSDAAHLSTKAQSTEDGYVLNGEKIYITSGGEADLYLVFARAGESRDDISAFVVTKSAPGLSFGKPERKMGCEGAPITSVHFENCRLPQSALVGSAGQGYRLALSGLNSGRVNIAAAACGLASRALELATAHARTRQQFGRALSQFQGIQFMLSDMLIGLRGAILLTRDAASAIDRGSRGNARASIAKCFATDAAMRITTDAVQALGGAGYLAEYEVERLMRDAKMLQIVEGTNQIQRIIIARSLLDNGA